MNSKRRNKFLRKFDARGQTIIITGANSGIGYSATKHFLALGAHVVMACRNLEKAEAAKIELLKDNPEAIIDVLLYDQASFASIDNFVMEVKARFSHFSTFVFNAGIYHPKKNNQTAEGFDLTMGTNYLGVYYLVKMLKAHQLLDESKNCRLIFVGSLSWFHVRLGIKNDFFHQPRSNMIKKYCQSKTAMGVLAYQLSRHDDESHVTVPKNVQSVVMHPGITSTNIVGSMNTSYPKWFSLLAKAALRFFVHSSDCAALGILLGALKDPIDENQIIVPRGLFHLSGLPKFVIYPKNLTLNADAFMKVSENIIQNTQHRRIS